MLNSLSVTQISLLSKFSKAYISQVKWGIRPPSKKLLKILEDHQRSTTTETEIDYFNLFMTSRRSMAASTGTMQFYRTKLGKFLSEVNADTATRQDIETFLLQFDNPGNRNAYHRVIKTFYNWRYETFNLPSPVKHLKAPRLGKLILPSLSKEQVNDLLKMADNARDKAIIAMFTESGLRLSELVNVCHADIDWDNGTIRVMGKGRKEALAPLGKLTQKHLEELIKPNDMRGSKDDSTRGTKVDDTKGSPIKNTSKINLDSMRGENYVNRENIWGLNQWGIISMLRRLEKKSGYPCNPHVFRRTFACLLRKSGLDVMTIKDLGRWESLEMVQRYTRSVTFQDSLKFYQSVLG